MPVKSSKYVDQVLSAKPKPPPPKQQDSGATAAMGRTGNRFGLVPLVQPAEEGVDSAGTAAGSGMAALRASAGTSTVFDKADEEPAGRTRPPGEWQPWAALPDENADYEVLLGPEGDAADAPPPARGGGGGSLLHGSFDEDESQASFQAAVAQWRGGGGGGGGGGGKQTTQAGGGTMHVTNAWYGGGGSSLLHGSFDEEESKASFQAAVAQWRGEAPPAPPPRRPAAAPAASGGLTLAQKVGAVSQELGLPEQPIAEAVAQANAIVGLQPIWSEKAAALPEDSAPSASESAARAAGVAWTLAVAPSSPPQVEDSPFYNHHRQPSGPLLEQVGRLLHELGLQPAAPQPAAATAMAVQTAPAAKPNYFALLQEQKKKDGLL